MCFLTTALRTPSGRIPKLLCRLLATADYQNKPLTAVKVRARSVIHSILHLFLEAGSSWYLISLRAMLWWIFLFFPAEGRNCYVYLHIMTDMYLILIVSWKTIKKMHLLVLQKHVACRSPRWSFVEERVHTRTLVGVTDSHVSYFSKCSIPKQTSAMIYGRSQRGTLLLL